MPSISNLNSYLNSLIWKSVYFPYDEKHWDEQKGISELQLNSTLWTWTLLIENISEFSDMTDISELLNIFEWIFLLVCLVTPDTILRGKLAQLIT